MSDKPSNLPIMFGPSGGRRNRFAEPEYAENTGASLKRIFSYFAKEKVMLFSLIGVAIAGTVCGIYAPSLQSSAVDIIAGSKAGNLLATVLFMLCLYLLHGGFQYIQKVVSAKLGQRIIKQMREELFSRVIDLPISYLDTHSHGDIMSRMTNDIENVSSTVSQSLPSLFSGVLTIIGTAGIMLLYCWQLALLSCVTVFMTYFASKLISKVIRKHSRQRQSLLGQVNGTVEEIMSGFRTVVAYNRQEQTAEDFFRTSDSLTKAGIKTDIFSGIMGPATNCISNIGFVIIAAFGSYFAIQGMISVGVISAFIVYAKQLSRPINEIANVYGQLQTAIAGAERVFSVLDQPVEDPSGEERTESETAAVSLKNVCFSYIPGQPVLKNVSLDIPAGKKIALVGATGSGKTTIANLLLRFYDIDSGEITINGQNIRQISRSSLRKEIAIVLQDTFLFTDSIRHNISYAKDSATQQELEQAAELSLCKHFIEQLDSGYDTILTDSGNAISHGQRQLLTIARAFVADPQVLILDEATSNVDTRTEKLIQNAMHKIMENRTSIVIAHRLSTIRDSDVIVVMDYGCIVEKGSHEELLAKKGKYYELYRTQYAGFAT